MARIYFFGFDLRTKMLHVAPLPVHPHVVGNGGRRLRRFDVARSPALAEISKFVGPLRLKRPEGRAPTNQQLVDALHLYGRMHEPFIPSWSRDETSTGQ